MEIVRDLIGGSKPSPIELPYNGDVAVDSVTKRYKGSFTKLMDIDDIDHGGAFHTFAGLATAMENFSGILEEEQGITGNYLPDDAAYGMQLRKITPCFPSSVIRAEYAQADAAGTVTYDTGATCTAGTGAFTITITTADTLIGGWIYMLNGSAAGELHYITNNSTTVATAVTAFTGAVASGDDFLVIEAANAHYLDFDATFTGLKSDVDDGAKLNPVNGLMTYISAPGIPFQRLDRNKHDGLVINNARFYHDFTIPTPNKWVNGITAA